VDATDYPAVTRRVLARLEHAPAFGELEPPVRRALRRDAQRIRRYLTPQRGEQVGHGTPAQDSLVDDVDFPDFVADLIKGTFNAIVDSSIQQMEAYGELLKDVSKSVDAFVPDDDDPDCRRRHRATLAVAVLRGFKQIAERRS
jgi:hypothetical protein